MIQNDFYRSKRPMDKEQLIFAADVILAGVLDVITSGLPDSISAKDRASFGGHLGDLTTYDTGALNAAGMSLAVLFAQYNYKGEGLGVSDALVCAGGFDDVVRQFVAEAWQNEGQDTLSRKEKLGDSYSMNDLYPNYPDIRKHAEAFVNEVFTEDDLDTHVYVIVENVVTVDFGDETDNEAICAELGYFTCEKLAEEKVNALNQKYLEDRGYTQQQIDDDEINEEHQDRFGFIPVKMV